MNNRYTIEITASFLNEMVKEVYRDVDMGSTMFYLLCVEYLPKAIKKAPCVMEISLVFGLDKEGASKEVIKTFKAEFT